MEGEQLINAKQKSVSVIVCDTGEKPVPVLVRGSFAVARALQRKTFSSDESVSRSTVEAERKT